LGAAGENDAGVVFEFIGWGVVRFYDSVDAKSANAGGY